MSQSCHKYPAQKGMAWHRKQYFTSFLPMDWSPLQWNALPHSNRYRPNPNDPATDFAVATTELRTVPNTDDLVILSTGYFARVEELPACTNEARNQQVTGKQLQLEAKYTFKEHEHTQKRWQHIVYHELRQIVFTGQEAKSNL